MAARMTSTQFANPYAARAHFRQHTARPVYWYDWREEQLYAPHGLRSVTPDASAIVHAMAQDGPGAKTLYILAGETNDTAPPHAWYREPLADGWHVTYRREQPPLRVATYTRAGSPEIQFRHTSAWFRTETDLPRIRRAYAALQRRLARDWHREGGSGGHVVLLASPAQTGLDLLARALPKPRDYPATPAYEYPIPSPELWESLHTYGYQHRLELCTDAAAAAAAQAPGYWYLDGRFAYAAHTRHVPTTLATHDHRNHFDPHAWGWYHITATIPASWRHLGIFKAPGELRWPCEPGAVIDTWTDSHEIKLALLHGWEIKIHERYVFADGGPGDDPLRTWNERLVKAYQDAQKPATGELGPLLKEACGHLVYDTLGTFKRSASVESVYVPRGAALPQGASDVQAVPGGFEAHVSTPLSSYQLQWAQVHWWVAITSKQRCDLMRRVLMTPRAHVGAIRTDAAHLFCERPDLDGPVWHDFGRVGNYRVKGHLDGPVDVPHDETELFSLIAQAVSHG